MKKQTKSTKTDATASPTIIERMKTARIDGTLSGCADELSRAQRAILGAVARLREAASDLPAEAATLARAMADEMEKDWKAINDKDLQLADVIAKKKTAEVKG